MNGRLLANALRLCRPTARSFLPLPLRGACSEGEFKRALSDNRERYFEQSAQTVGRAPAMPTKPTH